ncbi:LysR family transcriptional regulator [Nocardia yamanashiensis]|uniref:LysR family transcriptional regulator n=1 Tax=Nocardia yamanashiensis TaxID=209247 RepID=UPI00082A611E|nr:LysR family transcriptional regulator [Nocardia yamanashiensis]
MNTRLLESFLAVAAERNITRAAGRLHITQQTLSAQIRNLEREIGAALLVRDSRGVQLTAAGKVLAAGASRVVTELSALTEQVRAADAIGEPLRVVACPRASALFMNRVADALETAVPGTRVELVGARTVADGLRILEAGRADAGFLWAPLPTDTALRQDPIGTDSWVAALSPGHRLADRESLLLADLAAEPLVLPAIFVSDRAEQYWRTALRPPAAAASPAVHDVEDGPTLAARRRAVWLAPASMGRRYVDGNLRVIPVADAPPIDVSVVSTSRAPGRLSAELAGAVQATLS